DGNARASPRAEDDARPDRHPALRARRVARRDHLISADHMLDASIDCPRPRVLDLALPSPAGNCYPTAGVNGGSPLSTACTLATAIAAIWRRVSRVALPMWGSSTERGAARRRGWTAGSSE